MRPLANPSAYAATLWLLLLALLPLLACCTTDAYEKGTGKYSLMQADLAEITVDDSKRAVSFTTDDGDSYAFAQPVASKWIEQTDTIYRAIVYYNKQDDQTAEAMGISSVPTLLPREHWRFKRQPHDPVGMESAWMARSGKYLNMALLVKSGHTDDSTAVHTIALAQDTILAHSDGRRTAVYTFLHDQGEVPQYYTDRRYISVRLPQSLPDTIVLRIHTYEGLVTRRFPAEPTDIGRPSEKSH